MRVFFCAFLNQSSSLFNYGRRNGIEGIIIEYGNTVEQLEADKIDMKTAQALSTELFKDGMKKHLIVERNVHDIMELVLNDRNTFYYLKEKYGVQ